MGKVRKGQVCSIVGCSEHAVRSLASSEALRYLAKLNLEVKDSSSRRIYLCEKHYKMYKKASKKDRMFEKWWRGL